MHGSGRPLTESLVAVRATPAPRAKIVAEGFPVHLWMGPHRDPLDANSGRAGNMWVSRHVTTTTTIEVDWPELPCLGSLMRHVAWILCLTLSLPFAAADDAAPAPPLALHAAETQNGIHLNWTSPPDLPDVDGFRVYRSDGGAFEAIAETTQSTYLDASGDLAFMPGDGMSYYVTAFNEAGESPPSNHATGDYPRCWNLIYDSGPLNLPAWPALNCYLPPPLPDCRQLDDDPTHALPTEIRVHPC